MKITLPLVLLMLCPALLQAESSTAESKSFVGSNIAVLARTCANITDPKIRLACYDKLFLSVYPTKSAHDQAPDDAFGLSQNQLSARYPDSSRTAKIGAKITGVRINALGKRIITLDNDQIWHILEPTSKGDLKAGDQISVRKASLGTFMLISPVGMALRVRRIN